MCSSACTSHQHNILHFCYFLYSYISAVCLGPPPSHPHAALIGIQSSFIGGSAVYECDPGYNLRDNKPNTSAVCLDSQEWANPTDTCFGE